MRTPGKNMYKKYCKRMLDFLCSLFAILVFSPLFLLLSLVGLFAMRGNPYFVQIRPGKDGKLFRLLKFRTMTNETDAEGNLLPDERRLSGYGKFLRKTSLDELPQLFNILVGQMSFVGPRPQLVRDLVFMDENIRRRHSVRPGLTGLAQVSGRNAVSWEERFTYDLFYVEHVSFRMDVSVLFRTVVSVFRREGITEEGVATATDYGDYLLSGGKIDRATYDAGQKSAKELMGEFR